MITATADSEGRINLGKRFANTTFLVEETEDRELRLIPAQAVPPDEAWLFRDEEAHASVMRGLAHAKARQFSSTPPDLKADRELIEKLEAEE
ncbi:MAG: hypothetical protein AB1646_13500 [Thermodesulfobacteriota bacterium]